MSSRLIFTSGHLWGTPRW